MSDVLLRELSNADIDWLATTGQRQTLAATDILIYPEQPLDALYLLLEGHLTVCLPDRRSLQQGKPTCDRNAKLAQVSRGELLGESWLFNTTPTALVSADDAAVVLSIPKTSLAQKLQTDMGFAAHFYRALALILSERLRLMFEKPDQLRYGTQQIIKEALIVFSELHDSDIDWMISAGTVQKIQPNQVLLRSGRPVEALYTLLDGQLAITLTSHQSDPLALCCQGLDQASQDQPPIAYISRGGLPGISSFLEFQPLPVTIRATRQSQVFSIPRQRIAIKLQEDVGFASRFYRVMATHMANLLKVMVTLIGDRSAPASAPSTEQSSKHENLHENLAEEELDLDTLQQVCQGGTKFDWMLKQLGVSCG
jgi:CRP-like cAMP-binding protein